MKHSPLVSVIIPTKNSSEFIEKCLTSVRNQTYKNIEIIVIDNFSRDNTVDLAKKYTNLVFSYGTERCSQLNYGISKATGKYIYRVDSDFILQPKVVEEAINMCELNNYDGIAIHNSSDPSISFWSKVRHLERECYKNDETIVGLRFFTKKSLEAIGGFDTTLSAAEDYEIHNRFVEKGFSFGRIDSTEMHIGEPKTLKEFARKSYYYGQTMGNYLKKDTKRAFKQYNPFRMALIRNWKTIVIHPILFLGMILMNIVKYSMGFAGLLSTKLQK
jgi:glycosyltransferase involved in cell wall biosynthesis